jgi:hypothetical protein
MAKQVRLGKSDSTFIWIIGGRGPTGQGIAIVEPTDEIAITAAQ